jgi:tetratricopeptide (TPR) repeat protein
VGRASLIQKLETALSSEDQPQKIALYGLGGVGKTQVAIELAYRTRSRDPHCAIIWIPTDNLENLHRAYHDAADKLGISVVDKTIDVKRLVQQHFSQDSAGRWLIIYDNADDQDMWINKESHTNKLSGLINYVPRSSRGRVVFTTRTRELAVKLAPQGLWEEVREMDEDTAIKLLINTVNYQSQVNRDEAARLVTQLTNLPLAIVQATAYISAKGITLADYLSLLDDQEEDVIRLLSEDFEDDGRYRTGKNPVATTWLISFEQLRISNPLAADYLSLMSCFGPKDIPQSLLPPARSQKEHIDAVGALTAYSFVTTRSTPPTLNIHRLVHLATRSWLKKQGILEAWLTTAVTRLVKVFPNPEYENRQIWSTYLPHTRATLDSCLPWTSSSRREDLSRLLNRIGNCHYLDLRLDEAMKCCLQSVGLHRSVLGDEHPSTLKSMSNLAASLLGLGRLKEAEVLSVQVLEGLKKCMGEEHPETLISMNSLARIRSELGQHEEAEALRVQILEGLSKHLANEHPGTLDLIGRLSPAILALKRLDEEESVRVQVLEHLKKSLKDEHASKLGIVRNLAWFLSNLGQYEEAEALWVQALEGLKKCLGEEHPETLKAMNDSAWVLSKLSRYEEAAALWVQALERLKKSLGEEHPETLSAINSLAWVFSKLGRYEEAAALWVQVLEKLKKSLGEEHPQTLSAINGLAWVFSKLGRYEEAAALWA